MIEKYSPLKNSIAAEELIQLGLYELSLTDITEEDVLSINFLYNFAQHIDETIISGELGYSLITFISLASNVLAIKKEASFNHIISSITLDNENQLKAFCDDKSPFSLLSAQVIPAANKLRENMTEPMTSERILKQCRSMQRDVFLNLKQNINQLDPSTTGNLLAFFSRLQAEENNVLKLKDMISKLKIHLQNKWEIKNIDSIQLEDHKKVKLDIRYKTITWLNNELPDKIYFDIKLIKEIKETMEYIREKHPSWVERNISQKITDLLSIGIKPLYRGFFSHERNYESEIITLCNELETLVSFDPLEDRTLKIQRSNFSLT